MASIREELEDVCAKVRRQIEIHQSSWAYGSVGNDETVGTQVADLEAELSQLKDALANLEPDDA